MQTFSYPTEQPSIWKRFQDERDVAPFPLLVLDASATIRQITPSACRLLHHTQDALNNKHFLSMVHGRNMQRVMHDLAHLVHRRMQTASWLLRLRTGTGRWRWYRALVRVSTRAASEANANRTASSDSTGNQPRLFIRLRPA